MVNILLIGLLCFYETKLDSRVTFELYELLQSQSLAEKELTVAWTEEIRQQQIRNGNGIKDNSHFCV